MSDERKFQEEESLRIAAVPAEGDSTDDDANDSGSPGVSQVGPISKAPTDDVGNQGAGSLSTGSTGPDPDTSGEDDEDDDDDDGVGENKPADPNEKRRRRQ